MLFRKCCLHQNTDIFPALVETLIRLPWSCALQVPKPVCTRHSTKDETVSLTKVYHSTCDLTWTHWWTFCNLGAKEWQKPSLLFLDGFCSYQVVVHNKIFRQWPRSFKQETKATTVKKISPTLFYGFTNIRLVDVSL